MSFPRVPRQRPARRRRAARLIWPVLGLAAVGTVAFVVASRRRRPLAGAAAPEIGAGSDGAGGDDGSAADAGGAAAAELAPTWVAGPAGNLYVREAGGDLPPAVAHPSGGAPPVLFVHGLGGNGGQWALQIDHLCRRRRVLAPDLRGHGESDPAEDGAYDVDALAADVAAVADQFGLRRFVLVGHSLGAAVALAYADAHPERVAGLLMVDPNGDLTRVPAAEMEPFLEALRTDPLGEMESYFRQLVLGGDRDAAQWVLDDVRQTSEEAIPAAIAASMRQSPVATLERWKGPLLLVLSEMNSLPYSLHRLVPGLPVEVLRGTGHWLMMDRPEPFNAILDRFLASL